MVQVATMQNLRRTDPLALFSLHATEQPRQQGTHRHIEGFHNLVKYLVRLRKDGMLNDDEFNELVKRAAAASIEAKIADRVERGLELKVKKVLEDKIRRGYLLSLQK